ncbi:glutamine synthetase-like [Rhipicephalus sanguineus]|uniref:glutamine synthetase-like n=1 Tax=Rhipicephalus sanguineus TaxID=34632 RepID=UPI0018963CBD|nr:glutamine synthetase-like [Rhipicephalus sanguineus]
MATPRPDVFKKYLELEQPGDQVFCTYVFVDATLENVRSKMRVLSYEPLSPEECPKSTFCGKGTGQWPDADVNSELYLVPVALFRDPFLKGRNKLVLCEVLNSDDQPNETNTRRPCKMAMEAAKDEEPWFGIEQEYVLLERNGLPIGWPSQRHALKGTQEYFCAVGAENIAGRQVADAHVKACSYAGVKLYGSNGEAVISQWEYQIGPLPGVEAGDHLWISRYILQRVAEDFDVVVSFEPRPFKSSEVPGGAGHINFSTKSSRGEGGLDWINKAITKLELNHELHLAAYDPRKEKSNEERLKGNLLATPQREFSAGVASKTVCVRVPRQTQVAGRGFLEDRRPGANVEPYRAMQALVQTLCLAK